MHAFFWQKIQNIYHFVGGGGVISPKRMGFSKIRKA
jgi:hypothetical protein